MKKKERLVIFSFYDKDGVIRDYVLYLLRELSTIADRLIFVSNGTLSYGRDKVRQITDEIVIRDDAGFDAGAYRHILCDYLKEGELRQYKELVLCNDTFYGPLIKMQDIICMMDSGRSCDFWGMNMMISPESRYIQSYFLAFRESILKEDAITKYFENYILGESMDIRDAWNQFESGIFQYLLFKGYSWDTFCNIPDILPYQSGNVLLRLGMPVIKRRFFTESRYSGNIADALEYIREHFDYDIELITEDVNDRTGIDITQSAAGEKVISRLKPTEDFESRVIRYIAANKSVYIYGAGIVSRRLYDVFLAYRKTNVKAFVVSDVPNSQDDMKGIPVIEYSEALKNEPVIVALGKANTNEVVRKIGYVKTWLYLNDMRARIEIE